MPRVVRMKVEHGVAGRTTGDNETLVVGHVRDGAQRAGSVLPPGGGFTGHICHAVRRPQALEVVVGPHAHSCLRLSTAATISSTAESIGTALFWVPSRYRKDTAPLSTSSSPAISMYGTFCFCAVRIFFCIRSSESSSSNRIPRLRSRSATSVKYGTCSSAIGIPTTWTGASHGGKAPA